MFRIDKDQLLQDKAELDQAKADFDAVVERLGNIINRMPESWEGQAAQAYVEQFQEIRQTTLSQTSEMLEGISTQVQQVVDNAEALDSEMANQIH